MSRYMDMYAVNVRSQWQSVGGGNMITGNLLFNTGRAENKDEGSINTWVLLLPSSFSSSSSLHRQQVLGLRSSWIFKGVMRSYVCVYIRISGCTSEFVGFEGVMRSLWNLRA